MATGWAEGVINAVLDAICRSVQLTDYAGFYVQLHTADPGAAGTTAVFTGYGRVAATFGTAADNGAISNSAAVTFSNSSAAGTVTHVSCWDAASSGTFLCSDQLANSRVIAIADNFEIPIGDIDLDFTPIAA